ncbi:uncharacterized protein LOC18427375 isoform X2 [Amborella trichopoda]|nr:uncharacterized protein LOC18427375 isoform X2 [Amborella trichopoda]|eukprot:XP_020518724.1 uncharacterized protein LOC18427375 isoform X2 [Amborella trichopoda]
MPPEPSPWDRKEYLREKRTDATTTSFNSRIFAQALRPPGQNKQGVHRNQFSPQESHHGCSSRTATDFMPHPEDERLCISRAAEAKHRSNSNNTNSKTNDDRSMQQHRDFKWEGFPEIRPDLRPVADMLTHQPSSEIGSSLEKTHNQSNSKDQENASKGSIGLLIGHKTLDNNNTRRYSEKAALEPHLERLGSFGSDSHSQEHDHSLSSIGWKPLKWTRSGSLTSRSPSILSHHSNSSKCIKLETDMGVENLSRGKSSPPLQSPSGIVGTASSSSAPLEETCPSKKKPRLGWGEGLAKYEKEKVEGPDDSIGNKNDSTNKQGMVVVNTSVLNLQDSSPRLVDRSGCASPATPSSSVAYSSSPGLEDKSFVKFSGTETGHFNESPAHEYLGVVDGSPAKLEHLELNPISDVNSLALDLLQTEELCFGDSHFTRTTAINRMLLLKNDILKALEKTESEIDVCENELRSLNTEIDSGQLCSIAFDCVPESRKEEYNAALEMMSDSMPNLNVSAEVPGVVEVTRHEDEEVHLPSETVADDELDFSISKNCGLPCTDRELLGSDASELQPEGCVVDLEEPVGLPSPKGIASESSAVDMVGHVVNTSCDVKLHCGDDNIFNALIFSSNKDLARKATEDLAKALPSGPLPCDIPLVRKSLEIDSSMSSRRDLKQIEERLARRKRFLSFKERILTLKFRSLRHLWKEDMRLLSVRKHRAKPQKRFELSCRSSQSGLQKHRSSIRSRFTSPGNLTLVPTSEVVDFTSRLLSDFLIKKYRNNLKMPALFMDEKEKRYSRFVSWNGLVEDPIAVEKERATINPWTAKEKEVFMEMLAMFGKDFSKIASFLEHKTTADCVEFYYKNQKSESFEKIKKRLELKKQDRSFLTNTYLVTSGKKWHNEANAASLDVLGAASIVAACADDGKNTSSSSRHKHLGRSIMGSYYSSSKILRPDDKLLERSGDVGAVSKNERESPATDLLAGICCALSSEAMRSCITNSVTPGGHERRFPLRTAERPLTPVTTTADLIVQNSIEEEVEDTCSEDSCIELDWTDEEKAVFVTAVRTYGKDFTSVSHCVGSRSRDQCRIFFSKARKCLGLDVICPVGLGNEGSDADEEEEEGHSSDTDGVTTCAVEMDSALGSARSCSKMDMDMDLEPTLPRLKTLYEATSVSEMGQSEHDAEEVVEKQNTVLDKSQVESVFADQDEGLVIKGDEEQLNVSLANEQKNEEVGFSHSAPQQHSEDEDLGGRSVDDEAEWRETDHEEEACDSDAQLGAGVGYKESSCMMSSPSGSNGGVDLKQKIDFDGCKPSGLKTDDSPLRQSSPSMSYMVSAMPPVEQPVGDMKKCVSSCGDVADMQTCSGSISGWHCSNVLHDTETTAPFGSGPVSGHHVLDDGIFKVGVTSLPHLKQPKTQIISWQQENFSLSGFSGGNAISVAKDHNRAPTQNSNCQGLPATSGNGAGSKQQHRQQQDASDRVQQQPVVAGMGSLDFYKQHQQRSPSYHQQLDSPSMHMILRGHPLLQVTSNGDIASSMVALDSKKPKQLILRCDQPSLQSVRKENGSSISLSFTDRTVTQLPNPQQQQQYHKRQSNGSSSDTLFLRPNREVPSCGSQHLLTCPPKVAGKQAHSSGESGEDLVRSGDLKLFGKNILVPSQQSSSPESAGSKSAESLVPRAHENGIGLSHFNSSTKHNSSCGFSGMVESSSSRLGGAKVPPPSPPESGISMLSSKYLVALDDQQQPPIFTSAMVVNRNDSSGRGGGLVSKKELNAAAEFHHQLYKGGYDSVAMQPFTILSELQKRSSGVFQGSMANKKRGMSMNMNVGQGLVGGVGDNTVVSDPVAAMKMHFADQFVGVQAGFIGREEEVWRGDKTSSRRLQVSATGRT